MGTPPGNSPGGGRHRTPQGCERRTTTPPEARERLGAPASGRHRGAKRSETASRQSASRRARRPYPPGRETAPSARSINASKRAIHSPSAPMSVRRSSLRPPISFWTSVRRPPISRWRSVRSSPICCCRRALADQKVGEALAPAPSTLHGGVPAETGGTVLRRASFNAAKRAIRAPTRADVHAKVSSRSGGRSPLLDVAARARTATGLHDVTGKGTPTSRSEVAAQRAELRTAGWHLKDQQHREGTGAQDRTTLPASSPGGGAGTAYQRFQIGRSRLYPARLPVRATGAAITYPLRRRSSDHRFQTGDPVSSDAPMSVLKVSLSDRRFPDGGRCAARRSAAAGSPSGRPKAPRSPAPAPTTAQRLSTRGPQPPLSQRSPGQCRVRPTARQPLRAGDSWLAERRSPDSLGTRPASIAGQRSRRARQPLSFPQTEIGSVSSRVEPSLLKSRREAARLRPRANAHRPVETPPGHRAPKGVPLSPPGPLSPGA